MKLLHYIAIAAAAIGFTACSTDSEYTQQYLDIVTVVSTSNDAATKGSVLTFQAINDSPMITLTTTQAFSANQIGKRIVILYQGADKDYKQYTSGNINILQAVPTLGGGARIQPASVDSLNNWASDEIGVIQPFRSGKYLNLPMLINTSTNLRKFACYYDVNTIDNSYPELHVIMQLTPGYENTYSSNFYGSYDMGDIWNRPYVQGVKLIYNGGAKEVVLEKYPTDQQ